MPELLRITYDPQSGHDYGVGRLVLEDGRVCKVIKEKNLWYPRGWREACLEVLSSPTDEDKKAAEDHAEATVRRMLGFRA